MAKSSFLRAIFFVFFLLWNPTFSGVAGTLPEDLKSQSGRDGCPQCKNDGSQISQWLRRADELYSSFKTREAQKELLKVLQLEPENYEALCKMSRSHIDLGDQLPESHPDRQERRLKHYLIAEKYARKAVKADPNGAWGHFYVAASLGKIALDSPVATQIDLAQEIQQEVEKAIALDPQNSFAYHVYGVWHRRVAEIGQMRRLLATTVLWRSVPAGSLEQSMEYLRTAVSLNPKVILHRLELGKTYMAMGKWQLARSSLKNALELPIQASDDSQNKKEARQLLQEIKDY